MSRFPHGRGLNGNAHDQRIYVQTIVTSELRFMLNSERPLSTHRQYRRPIVCEHHSDEVQGRAGTSQLTGLQSPGNTAFGSVPQRNQHTDTLALGKTVMVRAGHLETSLESRILDDSLKMS